MKSITHGEVSFKQACTIIKEYIQKDIQQCYRITIGTDSQNFASTKMVVVIALWKVGKGGIFFLRCKKE